MHWKYDTNKFEGCNCGSTNFTYNSFRNGNIVQVCLKCKKCGEKWLNLWRDTHEIVKAEIIAYDIFDSLDDTQKELRFKSAEQKIENYINKYLRKKS